MRGSDGSRLALTSTIVKRFFLRIECFNRRPSLLQAENNIEDGSTVPITTVTSLYRTLVLQMMFCLRFAFCLERQQPAERKVTVHLSDDAGNELDMISNNTVKVAKLLTSWK